MDVHAGAIVSKERLGHERHGLPGPIGRISDNIFVHHHAIRAFQQRVIAHVNLGLARPANLVVVALDVDPGGDHSLHHFGAQILIVIRGRNREVTLFHARTVAKIVCLPRRIPPALFRIDKIKAMLRRAVEVHVIEDKKFRFRSEIRCIRDAGFFQVSLGPLRDPARIAPIWLPGKWIDRIPDHHQRRRLAEGVHERCGGIRHQQHV